MASKTHNTIRADEQNAPSKSVPSRKFYLKDEVLPDESFFWIGRGGYGNTKIGNAEKKALIKARRPAYRKVDRFRRDDFARRMLRNEFKHVKFVFPLDKLLEYIEKDDVQEKTGTLKTRHLGVVRRESILDKHTSVEQLRSYPKGVCVEVGEGYILDYLKHELREKNTSSTRKNRKDKQVDFHAHETENTVGSSSSSIYDWGDDDEEDTENTAEQTSHQHKDDLNEHDITHHTQWYDAFLDGNRDHLGGPIHNYAADDKVTEGIRTGWEQVKGEAEEHHGATGVSVDFQQRDEKKEDGYLSDQFGGRDHYCRDTHDDHRNGDEDELCPIPLWPPNFHYPTI